ATLRLANWMNGSPKAMEVFLLAMGRYYQILVFLQAGFLLSQYRRILRALIPDQRPQFFHQRGDTFRCFGIGFYFIAAVVAA
ncbi:MAG: hypothetical protein RLY97_2132, partial [Pseudomonadota bacterium]